MSEPVATVNQTRSTLCGALILKVISPMRDKGLSMQDYFNGANAGKVFISASYAYMLACGDHTQLQLQNHPAQVHS